MDAAASTRFGGFFTFLDALLRLRGQVALGKVPAAVEAITNLFDGSPGLDTPAHADATIDEALACARAIALCTTTATDDAVVRDADAVLKNPILRGMLVRMISEALPSPVPPIAPDDSQAFAMAAADAAAFADSGIDPFTVLLIIQIAVKLLQLLRERRAG